MRFPGKTGYLGVFPGHAPLISELAAGELTYRNGNQTKRLAVAWGFAEVLQTKVTILAEAAEKAEEIDTARAEAAKKKAEAELQKSGLEGMRKRRMHCSARKRGWMWRAKPKASGAKAASSAADK